MNKLSSEQWQAAQEFFLEAVDLDAEKQENFLSKIKIEQPELFEEVHKLLKSHNKSGAFLSGTVLDNIIVQAGEQIGPWTIIKEIGQGGMSTVYLAERSDGEFNRKVAVKFLHGLSNDKKMIERLRAEQSILAGLDHKHICKLFDAGIKDAGRPYFIMEYIDGPPIDEYCRKNNLSLDERLALFMQVCEAVQYAHKRLIVHRDIKPSNILVDAEGNAKLLDFGIAKLVNDDPEIDITNTNTGLFLMTPEYASPEQIEQFPITTATDVYSLGLLLFKLLTNKLPYSVDSKTPLEIGQTIVQTDPTKPSLVVTEKPNGKADKLANEKATSLYIKQAQKKLKGDLDNIILKALRKEPERRYDSAGQLLQDIYNYQNHLPVMARPESRTYRAKKFILRNKTAVAAAAIISIILMGATWISINQANIATEQRFIAEQRFNDVRELANSLIFELHDEIVNLPGATAARSLIVERALQYLTALTAHENADTNLKKEVSEAYRIVGDVQGNPTNPNLGRYSDAIISYQHALDLINAVLEEEPDNTEARIILANILENKSDVQSATGELELAEANQRLSNDIYRELTEEAPNQIIRLREYAISLLKYGDLLGHPNFTNLGKPNEALEKYTMAKDLLTYLYESDNSNIQNLRYKGLIHERIGRMYQEF
ncbi:MAG: serine/threonine protein kinase, partial [Balneolaceae bacterium]